MSDANDHPSSSSLPSPPTPSTRNRRIGKGKREKKREGRIFAGIRCVSLPPPSIQEENAGGGGGHPKPRKEKNCPRGRFLGRKKGEEKTPFFLPLLICDQWQVSSPPRRPPTLPLLWRRLAAAETMQKAPQFLSAANSKGGGDERVEQ